MAKTTKILFHNYWLVLQIGHQCKKQYHNFTKRELKRRQCIHTVFTRFSLYDERKCFSNRMVVASFVRAFILSVWFALFFSDNARHEATDNNNNKKQQFPNHNKYSISEQHYSGFLLLGCMGITMFFVSVSLHFEGL